MVDRESSTLSTSNRRGRCAVSLSSLQKLNCSLKQNQNDHFILDASESDTISVTSSLFVGDDNGVAYRKSHDYGLSFAFSVEPEGDFLGLPLERQQFIPIPEQGTTKTPIAVVDTLSVRHPTARKHPQVTRIVGKHSRTTTTGGPMIRSIPSYANTTYSSFTNDEQRMRLSSRRQSMFTVAEEI